ncbi:receptor protein kinase TMK1-like isoform X1 [Musa acuminata AAA Group]|uniref:receptor protein kinase TMK1-like isoform X1 n=1 Tax=Musa acuminata AAA Group TaxID=214697 RepID=UPI0031CF80D7
MALGNWIKIVFLSVFLCCFGSVVFGTTDAGDYAVLDEFRKGLANPELLKWPTNNRDPCGPPLWPHVFCSGSRVAQIQVQNLGLSGPLPRDFNKLSMLTNIGLQRNNFSGKLPSFSGLSNLQYAYLGNNQFDAIPSDFFVGLTSLQVLSLDMNPLNQSTGWVLPPDLADSAQLMNLSLVGCNLAGPLPEFLGTMHSLSVLKLSYNNLTGTIPASYSGLPLQILWLNNQIGPKLTGSLDVIASMTMLKDVWLHGNQLTGPIPSSIGGLTSLTRLWLNNNLLVGLVPQNLTSLPQLQSLQLDNNMFMGPIPKVSFNFTYAYNSFCQSTPGIPCSPEVTALLEFLERVNYPSKLAASWSGNDPCASLWSGVSCFDGKVSVINLPNLQLNGTISPSLGKLNDLVDVRLGGNNLDGMIPVNMTNLKLLKTLDLSSNNISPPVPHFPSSVKVLLDGNKLLVTASSPESSSTGNSPSDSSPNNTQSHNSPRSSGSSSPDANSGNRSRGSRKLNLLIVIVPIAFGVSIFLLAVLFLCFWKRRKSAFPAPSSIVVHPRDSSNPDTLVKIVVANNASNSIATNEWQSINSSHTSDTHLIESGNLVISVQVLRSATRNFASENVLGKGGFGVVYKGELHDGTMIAVKRMESAVLSSKALDEFHAEIAVLSKVRHRNLVSILGYSIEEYERLLVYEYMPQGALSKHLFRWKQLESEPLSWKKRMNIALDVARGMEYLHNLAHQCFIHRDLKSSNILLGDDYRAKVSDFGLAKLAPDGKNSVATRLAGTFGYLAPEYAVTGKVTKKIDVFSFGVVLMELLTGLMALDENRPEESRYLVSWFCQMKTTKENLKSIIDPALVVTDENFDSISIIAELAGHCAAREPQQRPDMGHAVNVLAQLAEKWRPMSDDQDEYLGIDLQQPLLQMVKGWQAADGTTDVSSVSLDDSKGSIPARPAGFAESFTSSDGR